MILIYTTYVYHNIVNENGALAYYYKAVDYHFNPNTKQVEIGEEYLYNNGMGPVASNWFVYPPEFYVEPQGDGTAVQYTHDGAGGFTTSVIPYTQTSVHSGCTDPLASNYDPNATQDNGTCVYPSALSIDALPAIAAAGNPIKVVLHARVLSLEPVPARATVRIQEYIPTGTTVNINGVVFTARNEPGAQEFFASSAGTGKTTTQVAQSLLQAAQDSLLGSQIGRAHV